MMTDLDSGRGVLTFAGLVFADILDKEWSSLK